MAKNTFELCWIIWGGGGGYGVTKYNQKILINKLNGCYVMEIQKSFI